MQARIAAIAIVALATFAVACGKKKQPAAPTEAPRTDRQVPVDRDPPADSAPADRGPSGPSLGEVIYFEFDQSDLSEQARSTLDTNAEWLKRDPARTITIEGHTDEVGTAEYNLGLGERRAKSARDYLIRLGIDANRVSVITYGEERPASQDDALNRRSVFIATRK
jgi:peptidoglycan-associated lipoprotein